MKEENELPKGWEIVALRDIAVVNPRVDTSELLDSTLVSFVPMAAVEAGTGRMYSFTLRRLDEVRRGYTAFQEGDVLFAKITPCMENGKSAVARALSSKLGFGSTEFHVLRPEEGIDSQLLYYYISQESFRQIARSEMTGSAGQLRVPAFSLSAASYLLAPTNEQHRIVSVIEQQFTRLDAAVAALQQAKAKLKRYRAAVLKAAVEGKLTEAWRAEHPDVEPASALLERILQERRAKWETDQLARMQARGVVPRDDKWKEAYKEPVAPDVEGLWGLPGGWCWATVEQVNRFVRYGSSAKTSADPSGVPVLRMGNVQEGSLDFSSLKYLPKSHSEFPSLLLEKGDLLFNRTNSFELVGKSAVYRGGFDQCSYASYLICVRMLEGCLVDYLCYFLNSGYGRKWIASVYTQQTGQANVNGSKLQALAFPLPPLAEQRQIISEVEERLSIIGQLEATVETNLKRAERLRQSILREAFAGRLVPQDPFDEPASVLLERIREERVRQEGQGKLTRKKSNKGSEEARMNGTLWAQAAERTLLEAVSE